MVLNKIIQICTNMNDTTDEINGHPNTNPNPNPNPPVVIDTLYGSVEVNKLSVNYMGAGHGK